MKLTKEQQQEIISQQSQENTTKRVTVKDLENILAEDLSTGDMETLRRRVVQLVMQVQEQNKREATKLVAVLNATESRTSEKIVESLKKQAAKYDELVQAKLLDQEIQLREKFSERLDQTIDDYTKKIQYVSESLVDKYDDEKNAKIQDECTHEDSGVIF